MPDLALKPWESPSLLACIQPYFESDTHLLQFVSPYQHIHCQQSYLLLNRLAA